jgi:hypothetical protein
MRVITIFKREGAFGAAKRLWARWQCHRAARSFDREHGTDIVTSETWAEPTVEKQVRSCLNSLHIDFSTFKFVD